MHTLKPIVTVKRKLTKLNQQYKEILDYYTSKPSKVKYQQPIQTYLKVQKRSDSTQKSSRFMTCDEHNDHRYDENAPKTIRRYQTLRDTTLGKGKTNILDNYMELIIQYGFIVLFSTVFPPAALLSCFTNYIIIRSSMNNFTYIRRFKAEVSNGIGHFMDCFEILTKLSIITNCGTIFFTSRRFRKIFVKSHENGEAITSWNLTQFLIFLLIVEHVLMILQMFFGAVINDAPDFVIEGERDRKQLHDNYEQRKEYDLKYEKEKERHLHFDHVANLVHNSNVSHKKHSDISIDNLSFAGVKEDMDCEERRQEFKTLLNDISIKADEVRKAKA